MSLTVGFDLDMTLIDSRPGIKATWDALSAETGVHVDSDLAVTRLGPPLTEELAEWFPATRIDEAGDLYRSLYPDHAIDPTLPMRGARAAMDAVHAHGGRVIVVTAKHTPNARMHVEHLNLPADEVIGRLWAEQKGEALREADAAIYVGDHLGDIKGARTAGAVSVAVATGPIPADELRAAGADVVLDDLTAFPAWLDAWVSARR
ncbi:haloacid dehalogenase [Mangrovactinospora gilvigrisea]|uniref:Haloacid dehalogenase n=1 Tax=Mangrovactinospora gilvigrisea TaxID=1428644 RepID=A0A1J7CBM7_9ACTN|nr:HAD hydrolase-like protein [Mangrovactinospora gilvigrisea]OIV37050.1 haloacid dehalogenase [Mangrovactinospora gilvigrisea]